MSRQKPVEVFVPPNTLKAKTGGGIVAIDEEAIKRAEAALETLSSEFGAWLEEEVEQLLVAREDLRRRGKTAAAIDLFHTRAHDLKGQGTTYSFPFVTLVSGSLCSLIENLPEPDALPLSLVDAHVDAIRAIVRQEIKGDTHPVGLALVKELSDRVKGYVSDWDKEKAQG